MDTIDQPSDIEHAEAEVPIREPLRWRKTMLRCASVLISLTAKSGWKSSKRQGILPPFHQVPAVPGKNSNWQVKLNGYLQRIELLF